MNTSRQVKRCPHCGTMADQGASACAICGRQFRTNDYAPPPEFNPDRTQMLTLPPMLKPSRANDRLQDQESFHFIEPVMPRRTATIPLATVVSVLALLLGTFIWVLAR